MLRFPYLNLQSPGMCSLSLSLGHCFSLRLCLCLLCHLNFEVVILFVFFLSLFFFCFLFILSADLVLFSSFFLPRIRIILCGTVVGGWGGWGIVGKGRDMEAKRKGGRDEGRGGEGKSGREMGRSSR